jgi:hypothetical protein
MGFLAISRQFSPSFRNRKVPGWELRNRRFLLTLEGLSVAIELRPNDAPSQRFILCGVSAMVLPSHIPCVLLACWIESLVRMWLTGEVLLVTAEFQ